MVSSSIEQLLIPGYGYVPAGPPAFFHRATTINFMLARGASGFQIGGKRMYHCQWQFFLSRAAVRWFDLQVFSSTELFYLCVLV